jgi:putative acetyltransferase
MTSRAPVVVELCSTPTDEVRTLVAALETELAAEYSAEQRHGLKLEAIFTPHVRFFIARLDGEAIGCGGVALFADFAEVKRMYVRDAFRGRGGAQALLARIEAETLAAGLTTLRLETGDRQAAAVRVTKPRASVRAPHSATIWRWNQLRSQPAYSSKNSSRPKPGFRVSFIG